MNEVNLTLLSPPVEIANALYGGLIQAWLDSGQSILPDETPQASAGDHSTPVPLTVRNPADEEKIRLIILSGLSLWMMFSQSPTMKSRIFNAMMTFSDPAKWAVIAGLIWGP